MPKLKQTCGNAIAEYGLIGMSVAVVCLGGLMSIGNGLNTNLDQFQKSLAFTPTKVTPTSKAPLAADTTMVAAAPLAAKSLPIPLKPKNTITLTSTPTSGTTKQTLEALQVSGANGATELLSNTLTLRADTLLASGEITQEQANLLYDLANEGHTLAESQAVFENALQTGQSTVLFGNKKYKLTEYGFLLGFKKRTTPEENWELNPTIASPLLQPFAAQYQAVTQSDMFQNPTVKEQVGSLVIQIGALSDSIGWSIDDIFQKETNPISDYNSVVVTHFLENMQGAPFGMALNTSGKGSIKSASSLTNNNAVSICQAGSGKDSGTLCTAQ